jgi:hypothetical protein
MARTLKTKLEIKSWDEKPYRELEDGRKFARAEVTLAGTDDAVDAATFESLLYYAADGSSTYVTIMEISATLAGRSGTVVLRGEGTYDGTTANMTSRIVAGTGDLAGVSGRLKSVSTHADYPNMPVTLTYELK